MLAFEEAQPKGRRTKKKTSGKGPKRVATSEPPGQRDLPATATPPDPLLDVERLAPSPLLSESAVRCRGEGIAVVAQDPFREVVFGGEAMKIIVDHVCQTEHARFPIVDTLLRQLLRLTKGAVTMATLAKPRAGGCDTSAKLHGVAIPYQCTLHSNSMHVRIGGASLGNGKRASRQARPGFEVTFRFGDSELDKPPVPCTCYEVRKVILEAAWTLLMSSSKLWANGAARFGIELLLLEGLAGSASFLETDDEASFDFAFKHVGACFRQAVENGTDIEDLDTGVRELRDRVGGVNTLLNSWQLDDSSLAAKGVLMQMYSMLLNLEGYTKRLLSVGAFADKFRLCTPSAPPLERRAAAAEEARWVRDVIEVIRRNSTGAGEADPA